MDLQKELIEFHPCHDYYVGIDSDGCVFDSMEVKQKEFFIPLALKYFNLFPIAGILRRTWEFINLYSINRGGNRFISLVKVFDLLEKDESIRQSAVQLPDLRSLRIWIDSENKLGNESLRNYYESNPDNGIEKVLLWSEAVNNEIRTWLKNIPPFPAVKGALELISGKADIAVISQTPLEAVKREWEENDLSKLTKLIAGQEHGTKAEHLSLSAAGKYSNDKILMIGDAKGDLDAAHKNGVLFYPVVPGYENDSWERFMRSGFSRFIDGSFRGEYENSLINEFLKHLPEKPDNTLKKHTLL
ncbi:MAG TPA: HAD hydrolase-like protein [Bacteroidales bacterium]|nr:HAD hydrolase-like protein [Bacteroidales bacterium]